MTKIRLAGNVVNYLSKEVWGSVQEDKQVTGFFDKKETKNL
jgi:hypothetical protein